MFRKKLILRTKKITKNRCFLKNIYLEIYRGSEILFLNLNAIHFRINNYNYH